MSQVQHSMQVFSSLRLRKRRHQQQLPVRRQPKGQQLRRLQRRRLQRGGPPFRLLLGCWGLEVMPRPFESMGSCATGANSRLKLLHLTLRPGIEQCSMEAREQALFICTGSASGMPLHCQCDRRAGHAREAPRAALIIQRASASWHCWREARWTTHSKLRGLGPGALPDRRSIRAIEATLPCLQERSPSSACRHRSPAACRSCQRTSLPTQGCCRLRMERPLLAFWEGCIGAQQWVALEVGWCICWVKSSAGSIQWCRAVLLKCFAL